MGYYTDFNFENNKPEVIDAIHETTGYCESGSEGFYSDAKWYDWQNHLKIVSKKFPEELIRIEGEGEESGDIWKAYFKNGKMQYTEAKLVFEEFDEAKLK